MVGKLGDFQIIVNSPVASVPRCTGSNAKTLGLKHLQFPDMGASGGPPDGVGIVHGTDEPTSYIDSSWLRIQKVNNKRGQLPILYSNKLCVISWHQEEVFSLLKYMWTKYDVGTGIANNNKITRSLFFRKNNWEALSMFRSRDSGLCHHVALTVQSSFWRNILASIFTNQSTHRSGNQKSYHTNNLFKSLRFSGWPSVQWIVLWALVLIVYVAGGQSAILRENVPFVKWRWCGKTYL